MIFSDNASDFRIYILIFFSFSKNFRDERNNALLSVYLVHSVYLSAKIDLRKSLSKEY